MTLDVTLFTVLVSGFNLTNCRHPCLILPFLLESRVALGMVRHPKPFGGQTSCSSAWTEVNFEGVCPPRTLGSRTEAWVAC